MNLEITSKQLTISDPIKEFINKKIEKFPKLVGPLCDFHFVVAMEKHRYLTEIILTTNLGKFNASAEAKDIYGSLGAAIEKIEKQVKRNKEKLNDSKKPGISKEELNEIISSNMILEMLGEFELKENPEIVEMVLEYKPLSLEEATLELKNSSGNFLVFYNSQTENMNVLYKRKDGNFGLIRPV